MLELIFLELIEYGFFEAFWNWSNPALTLQIYFFILIGAAIQYLLLKKCQKRVFRFGLIGLCAIYTLVSEYAMIFITGWDRFGIIVLYGFVICILIGAVFMTIIQWIKNRNQNKKSAEN